MHPEALATELITHIFTSATSVQDVLALSSTCRRYRTIFASQRLAILAAAAESQYGPLHDAIQLLTHNASQPVHVERQAPLSLALLKQVLRVGLVAEKWTDLYPFKRWKLDFENRRLLTLREKYRIRRAVYRLWLYTIAFHNVQHGRHTRLLKLEVQSRARLLYKWSTSQLVEMADVQRVMRDVVAENVCPSNSIIGRRWRKRFPDANGSSNGALMFNINININYPPPSSAQGSSGFQPSEFHSAPGHSDLFFQHHRREQHPRSTVAWSKYNPTPHHNPGAEGWGDDITHYYVVEDMMKLSPAQILFLKDKARFKTEVEAYKLFFAAGGDLDRLQRDGGCDSDNVALGWEARWFDNNGETWGETLRLVLEERGEDVAEVLGEDGMRSEEAWGVVAEDDDD